MMLPESDALRVEELGEASLGFREEPQRFYPHGNLASHVLGHVNIDSAGQEGAEAAFEGFSRTALLTAARRLELPKGEPDRLFPGGALQILTWLSERADRRTVEALEKAGDGTLKMRDRIKLAVRTRIELVRAQIRRLRSGLDQMDKLAQLRAAKDDASVPPDEPGD